jgi:hypothetical protein
METNPLWLITGVDVLIQKKTYFKMSQKIKNILVHSQRVLQEKDILLRLVQKDKKYKAEKNIFSMQNFVSEHIRFGCTLENFIVFFNFKLQFL